MSTAIFHDFEDTIPTAPGAFNTIGDDQAERHSGWGALTGKLTEAELDANIGNVIPLHRGFVAWDGNRSCPPCHQNCDQGDQCPHRLQPQSAEDCSDIGADEPCRPPVTRIGLIIILLTGWPLLVAMIGGLLAVLR